MTDSTKGLFVLLPVLFVCGCSTPKPKYLPYGLTYCPKVYEYEALFQRQADKAFLLYVPSIKIEYGGFPAMVPGFLMDMDPVTHKAYAAFLNQVTLPDDLSAYLKLDLPVCGIKKENGRFVAKSSVALEPVRGVTWQGSQAYARHVGGYLPSEMEYLAAFSYFLPKGQHPLGEVATVMNRPPSSGVDRLLLGLQSSLQEWTRSTWFARQHTQEPRLLVREEEASLQEPHIPRTLRSRQKTDKGFVEIRAKGYPFTSYQDATFRVAYPEVDRDAGARAYEPKRPFR